MTDQGRSEYEQYLELTEDLADEQAERQDAAVVGFFYDEGSGTYVPLSGDDF
jgi:hypothetical protein